MFRILFRHSLQIGLEIESKENPDMNINIKNEILIEQDLDHDPVMKVIKQTVESLVQQTKAEHLTCLWIEITSHIGADTISVDHSEKMWYLTIECLRPFVYVQQGKKMPGTI